MKTVLSRGEVADEKERELRWPRHPLEASICSVRRNKTGCRRLLTLLERRT